MRLLDECSIPMDVFSESLNTEQLQLQLQALQQEHGQQMGSLQIQQQPQLMDSMQMQQLQQQQQQQQEQLSPQQPPQVLVQHGTPQTTGFS